MQGLERSSEQYSYDTKEYECFWGEGYHQDNRSILQWHGEEYFSEERGYHPHDVENIRALNVNQSLNLSCVTGEHWVRRVK
jgi:hypothetical protein